jgi:adenylate cyclase
MIQSHFPDGKKCTRPPMDANPKPPMKDPSAYRPPVSARSIQRQLQRIAENPSFRATAAQKAFLQFIVEKALAGESDEIKGYTIATQVFGRRPDFNQATDPVVSIHANKLRRALEHYYLVEGKSDPIRIDIPKGTYVPTFLEQSDNQPEQCGGEAAAATFEASWPVLLIRPFQNLTDDPELNYVAVGLATELATEITRYREIRVLVASPEGLARRASDSVARFAVDGSVRMDASGIKVAVQLTDLANSLQIWCDTHQSDFDAAKMIAYQERVARVISAKLASEGGIIAKAFAPESKTKALSDLKTYEAILRYHEFNSNFTPKTFMRALEALNLATAREPTCGLAWSMLARLYANNYTLELSHLSTPLEDAVAFAEKGAKLEPTNQRVLAILAYVLLIKNDLAAGRIVAEKAFALNPTSLIMMDLFGYLLTLLGDWQHGPALIREVIRHNPFYSVIVHHALWADAIRQQNYDLAYLETLNFRTPGLFWEPLMKAAGFGLLGRIEEGKRAVEDLLALKPDFPARGRTLIGHHIKFEDIAERMIAGLGKCGLEID